MNSVEQELLISELRDGINLVKNLKIVNDLVSSSNAWDSLSSQVTKNKKLAPYKRYASEELWKDQHFSASTHMYELITILVDNVDYHVARDMYESQRKYEAIQEDRTEYRLRRPNYRDEYFNTLEDAWDGFRKATDAKLGNWNYIEHDDYDYSFENFKETLELRGIKYFSLKYEICDICRF